MYRALQNSQFKNVNAQEAVKVDMKRGTFVTINEGATISPSQPGRIELATNLEGALGILTRDTKVTDEVANGRPVSMYSEEQDTVKAGEMAGVVILSKGERYCTNVYDTALIDTDVAKGKYLAVADGKLTKSEAPTSIMSLGWMTDAGHKVLGYVVLQ